MTRIVLRTIAVLIAVAAVIDPSWSRTRPTARQVVGVRLASTATSSALRLRSGQVERELRSNGGADLVMREVVDGRLPCGIDERCVLIADGSVDVDVPSDLTRPVSMLSLRAEGGPNVSIRSAIVSPAHITAAGAARIELSGQGVTGQDTQVRIVDGAAVIGSGSHRWTGDTTVSIDVPWWPIASQARRLHIEAVPLDGELSVADNTIDVGVTIDSARAPLLVFDARPSWSSTFVRRALEDDPRFAVDYRARVAPALSTGTANGRLDSQALDAAAVVAIGGPDALTAAETALLDRFVRIRGGTLILLPERRDVALAAPLFPGDWTEHLTPTPERLGPLHATEILRAAHVPATSTVLARSGESAAVVIAPSGRGHVVVSGAMDAWRYRQQDPSTSLRASAFDQFWRSLAAEAATAGEGLQLTFDRDLVTRGSRARFVLRDRRMTPPSAVEASATMQCGNGERGAVRLWPSGPVGEFTGEIPAAIAGECGVGASIGDRTVTASIAVADRPSHGVDATLGRLERAVASTGGVVAREGNTGAVTKAIAAEAIESSRIVTIHPMRSPWWIILFAGCLSLEWWLRRRRGLR